MQDISSVPFFTQATAEALAVNNSGLAVGWFDDGMPDYDPNGMSRNYADPVAFPGQGSMPRQLAREGQALAVNSAGQIVGYWTEHLPGPFPGMTIAKQRASVTGVMNLNLGTASIATGINDKGQVVGSSPLGPFFTTMASCTTWARSGARPVQPTPSTKPATSSARRAPPAAVPSTPSSTAPAA
jgi:hypothetical protein